MEAKTHEMSTMPPSPRHAEMNAELEALRQARDQLKVECTELQSKNESDLSDDESRRYAMLPNAIYLCRIFISYCKNLNPLKSLQKRSVCVDFVYILKYWHCINFHLA